jgi:hypothetical protein
MALVAEQVDVWLAHEEMRVSDIEIHEICHRPFSPADKK